MDDSIKIQAFLAHAGVASRRKSEELVAAGRVKINGRVAIIGQRVVPSDTILLDGKSLHSVAEHSYFLVYKPPGVVSTVSDELHRKNVVSLLPATAKKSARLFPVGRLDAESEGLVLLTDDGDLAYQLTHPKFEVPKTYHVTVNGFPSEAALRHLQKGVRLKEGYTRPAQAIVLISSEVQEWTQLEISITQGWNHQVRRMFERVGYTVTKLIRTRLGPFNLTQLNHRPWIQLSSDEVAKLTQR